MAFIVLLAGLLLIAFRIWWCKGIVIRGNLLCQGKILTADSEKNQITVEYYYKKERMLHVFDYDSFPLRAKRKGVKVPLWVDNNDPEKITNIVQSYADFGAYSRISLLLGCIFTLCSLLVIICK